MGAKGKGQGLGIYQEVLAVFSLGFGFLSKHKAGFFEGTVFFREVLFREGTLRETKQKTKSQVRVAPLFQA